MAIDLKAATPYLWMLLGACAFSVMGAFTHGLHDTFAWQTVALVRAGIALSLAVSLALATGARLVLFDPPVLWVRSVAGSLSLLCAFYSIPHLPLGDSYTLSNMFPVWVALLCWPLLGERPGRGAWLAVVCGIAGVVCIQQPHIEERNMTTLVALAAALAGSFTTAVAMLGLHQLHQVNTRAVVAHFSGVSVLFCIAALWIFPIEETKYTPDAWSWAMLAGVGVSATAGQLCLTKAFALGKPARVSVVALSQVGFAVVFDVLVFRRELDALKVVGMSLVLAPTCWLILRGRATPAIVDEEMEAEAAVFDSSTGPRAG